MGSSLSEDHNDVVQKFLKGKTTPLQETVLRLLIQDIRRSLYTTDNHPTPQSEWKFYVDFDGALEQHSPLSWNEVIGMENAGLITRSSDECIIFVRAPALEDKAREYQRDYESKKTVASIAMELKSDSDKIRTLDVRANHISYVDGGFATVLVIIGLKTGLNIKEGDIFDKIILRDHPNEKGEFEEFEREKRCVVLKIVQQDYHGYQDPVPHVVHLSLGYF